MPGHLVRVRARARARARARVTARVWVRVRVSDCTFWSHACRLSARPESSRPTPSAPPAMIGQSTVSSAVLAENELARLPRGRRAARARHARRERAAYIARGAPERG